MPNLAFCIQFQDCNSYRQDVILSSVLVWHPVVNYLKRPACLYRRSSNALEDCSMYFLMQHEGSRLYIQYTAAEVRLPCKDYLKKLSFHIVLKKSMVQLRVFLMTPIAMGEKATREGIDSSNWTKPSILDLLDFALSPGISINHLAHIPEVSRKMVRKSIW